MNSYPDVAIMIITYKRTAIAIRTIEGIKKHLIYPINRMVWHIADDGSNAEHISALKSAIGECTITNSDRHGVGASMNLGMAACLKRASYILWLEDDWELFQPFDLRPSIELLQSDLNIGMVRFGYISPGLRAELISASNRLWWRLVKNPNYQYTFTGHSSLRSKSFCDAYGKYKEGLAPGQTELYMCGTFNHKVGPDIAIPADMSPYGTFAHIGGESYKDVTPG